jgi:hypothetical protein
VPGGEFGAALTNGFKKLANSIGKINFVAGPAPSVFSVSRYRRLIDHLAGMRYSSENRDQESNPEAGAKG